jgi:hypothetical protein
LLVLSISFYASIHTASLGSWIGLLWWHDN